MKVVRHGSNNTWLLAPKGVPRGVEVIKSAPATRAVTAGLKNIRTYWQPSEQDIANLLAGGLIELVVYGERSMLGMKIVPAQGLIQPELPDRNPPPLPKPPLKPPHLR